jgi:thioredoxin:protein disulfide reductase
MHICRVFVGLLFCFLSSVSWAFKTNVPVNLNLKPLHIESVRLQPIKGESFQPGGKAKVEVDLRLDDGFHGYLDQFKLKWIGPEGFHLSEPAISPTVTFTDPISKKKKVGAKEFFVLTSLVDLPTTLPPENSNLEMELRYQACAKDFCLLPINVPVVHKFRSTVNTPSTFSAALDQGWLYALFFVFLAGVLTSFTPCIFPMIPITMAVIGSKGERSKWRGFLISFVYVLGIAFTYSLLGLFAARSGALFGAYLGHPVVVSVIAGVFVLMALSLFGLFEIRPPQFIASRLAGLHTEKNFVGAFVSGLSAGIVASPCVGPVLVGVLTYVAQTQNMVQGFVLLFTFALGLGQIFLVLGTFQSLLHSLPKSGPWMVHVKKFFGVVMLGMAFYYLQPVLKKPWAGIQQKYFDQAPQDSADYAKPDWQPYSEDLLAKSLRENRPVIIDFQAEWCLACKELEKYTFSDPRVLEVGKQFLWLAFDATEPSAQMDELQKKYGIGGLPFVVLYNKRGNVSTDNQLTGFEKADAFLKRLERVLAD